LEIVLKNLRALEKLITGYGEFQTSIFISDVKKWLPYPAYLAGFCNSWFRVVQNRTITTAYMPLNKRGICFKSKFSYNSK
jgi:hypothetical protein